MKKIRYILYTFIAFSCFFRGVDAASVSIYSSSNTVVVGNSFNVSVTVSSDAAAWDFSVGYDSSKLRVVSANLESGMRSASTSDMHSRNYSITFKAISSGTASVWVSDALLYNNDAVQLSASKGSRSFTLRTWAEIQASYSKNNNLSSLGVDGANLSPEFNKDTLEYTVELEPGTEKINVTASVEDGSASLSGTGEKEVTEGDNNIEVVVTAENGSTKTYKINAIVKEFNPVKVKVDGKEYTVVRNKKNLEPPANYEETTIKINEEEVPAYQSKITKYLLVSLKDPNGNQNWYVKEKDNYKLYKEYKFSNTVLYPLELEEIPTGYSKTSIKYNDEKIVSYKLKNSSKYALIYAMNVETGKENIYMYDSKEDTVQIYNDEHVNKLMEENDLYLKILIGLSAGIVLCIGIIIFILIRKKKSIKE